MKSNYSRDHQIALAVAAGRQSLADIGRPYGLSAERVRQIAKAAMLPKKPRTLRLGRDFIEYMKRKK